MRMPLKQLIDLGLYMRSKKRSGEKYFPLVLMLEPLHACNLACVGCGRIVEYKDSIRDMMPLEDALASAQECDAPLVSICGGEPLMYKHIAALTKGLIEDQKRHVMICTNAILLERFVKQVAPSPYLSFNLHLDGMRATNDRVTDRAGHFDIVIKMVKMLKDKGYRVQTNTTVFRETTSDELEEMVKYLGSLGVDGMLLSPGYHYQVLDQRRPVPARRRERGEVPQGARLVARLQHHQYADLSRFPGRRARPDLQPVDHRHAKSAADGKAPAT